MSKKTYQIIAIGAAALAVYYFVKSKKKNDVITEVPIESPKANFVNPLVPHYGRPIKIESA